MSKGQRKQAIHCQQHQFSLTPLRGDVYHKQRATLSYCKGRNQQKKKGQAPKTKAEQNCSCCPIFNKDRNHATNSFILPEEQQNFMQNSEKFKSEHDCRVCEYNDEKTKLFVPKPKTRYSYCSVCRSNYEDYLEHIQNVTHKNNVNKSKISEYIRDLERRYQGKRVPKKIVSKTNESASTHLYPNPQAEPNADDLGQPSKRTKLSQSTHNPAPFSASTLSNLFPSVPISNPYLYQATYAGFLQQIQLMASMAPPVDPYRPMGMPYTMVNPYLYMNPCPPFYNPCGFLSSKPVVIDLEAKED